MGKIVRLTESKLKEIIERIILEDLTPRETPTEYFKRLAEALKAANKVLTFNYNNQKYEFGFTGEINNVGDDLLGPKLLTYDYDHMLTGDFQIINLNNKNVDDLDKLSGGLSVWIDLDQNSFIPIVSNTFSLRAVLSNNGNTYLDRETLPNFHDENLRYLFDTIGGSKKWLYNYSENPDDKKQTQDDNKEKPETGNSPYPSPDKKPTPTGNKTPPPNTKPAPTNTKSTNTKSPKFLEPKKAKKFKL